MNQLTQAVMITVVTALVVLPASTTFAQETGATETLPDAKPGECYAKVITPARFETRTEEVVVQEASERIETVAAQYATADDTVVVKDASETLSVTPAVYTDATEQVLVQAAENNWTVQAGGKTLPASPGSLEGITGSGVDLDTVSPGMCFREYVTEAQYKVESRRVQTREASEKIALQPAVFETVDQQVLVKEAGSKVIDVPAVYRTETESVLVEPARSVWKKGRGPVERIDDTTGEIMCLVEVPARYETITRTVLDQPATTRSVSVPAEYETVKVQRQVTPASTTREAIPAEYETVEARVKTADAAFYWLASSESADDDASYTGREVCLTERPAEYKTVATRVLSSPPSVESTAVPARYETMKVQKLASPASEKRITIPARTRTVTSKVQVADERLQWRKVLCETNMTPNIITNLQRALKREGFNPGVIDGVVGKGTMDAIEEYQTREDLDRGGITYETLKKLKVQS